jgi:hypothetical protein
MGLEEALVAKIRLAAAVHDVGKISVPRAILNKPDALSAEEFAVMRSHVETGAQFVSGACDEQVVAMVRHHHERLDGTGYPDGLSGDAIPIGARIIAVADTFDAIISTRPYHRARSHKQAMDALVADAGTKLDGAAVDAFRRGYEGRRALGAWVIVADLPRSLLSGLGADVSAAGIAPLQASLAGVVMAAVVGTPLLGTHSAFEPPPRAVPSALPARVQTIRDAQRPVARSAFVNGSRRSGAAHRLAVVLPLRTIGGEAGAAAADGGAFSIPSRGPSAGGNDGSGSGAPGGSGGAAGQRNLGGTGRGGGPGPGEQGPGGPGTPAGQPPPNTTLTDRIVGVATGVTNRVPAPVGPVGTGVLDSAAATLDRTLPAPVTSTIARDATTTARP